MNDKIFFKPYKIFERGNRKFLYCIDDSGLYEIDNKIEQILALSGHTLKELLDELMETYKIEPKETKKLVQMLYSAGLVESSNSIEIENKQMQLAALTLMISQECNMKCGYCYGDGGEYKNRGIMSVETSHRAIDYLVKNSKDTKLAIAFLGGEPLMNFNLIKDVLHYCKIKTQETGKIFSYTITTNGTLLTPEIEDFLINNQIKTQISIDGTAESHNQMRYFAQKKPSYDIVVSKTKHMREQHLLTARATLSPKNLDYVKTFNHLKELGFIGIPIEPAKNLLSETDLMKELNEYIRYIKFFTQQVRDGQTDTINKITDFTKAIEKIDTSGKRKYGCGAFHRMYAVDIDGKLYPCHRFVGIPEFCLGSVYDDSTKENNLWHNVDSRNKCSKCWLKNLCGGGCAYENFMETGNINIPTANFCQHMELLYSAIIDVYIEYKYLNN